VITNYPPIGRGQGHVTCSFKFWLQSYLWNWWSWALQISCADWYKGVL